MSASPRKSLRELERLLEEYGITIIDEVWCKKHRKVRITDGARNATIVVSSSPSDRRSQMNAVKTARHSLRDAP